jgi:type II secretory pathway pseudopilin PulG
VPIRLYVRTRFRQEGGFGLIELLMAITMLNIGILAIVAAFNSGIVTLKRSSMTATASVLADQQMELYRAVTWDQIALDSTTLGTADNTYKCDSVLGGSCPNSTSSEVTVSCGSLTNQCNPSRSVVGPDRHKYRVDTYIVPDHPSGASRTVRKVTVVVRDGSLLSHTLARETSTFDCSTALPYAPGCPAS